MIDKTVLELVDRLVATNTRAAKAEIEAEKWKDQTALNMTKLSDADAVNATLRQEIQSLNKKLEEQKNSTSFWYNEAQKFEKELKEYKGKKASEEANQIAKAVANRVITAEMHNNMQFEGI